MCVWEREREREREAEKSYKDCKERQRDFTAKKIVRTQAASYLFTFVSFSVIFIRSCWIGQMIIPLQKYVIPRWYLFYRPSRASHSELIVWRTDELSLLFPTIHDVLQTKRRNLKIYIKLCEGYQTGVYWMAARCAEHYTTTHFIKETPKQYIFQN